MKKRIETAANSVVATSEGVEFRMGDDLVARIFVRNDRPHSWFSGIAEPMAIRKVSIQDQLDWILIDFDEHDEIYRAAIRLDEIDWDQVDFLLEPCFREGRVSFHRRKASDTEEAELGGASNIR